MLASFLLQLCQSFPVDAAKFTASNDLCVPAKENARQYGDSWINFSRIWLPTSNATFENTGIVLVDGHSSHVNTAFIEIAAQHSIYVMVEPSHTSKLLQVADVVVKNFIKQTYER